QARAPLPAAARRRAPAGRHGRVRVAGLTATPTSRERPAPRAAGPSAPRNAASSPARDAGPAARRRAAMLPGAVLPAGAVVRPGFHDHHLHLLASAARLASVDVSAAPTLDLLLARVA